jgi:hypothetical protein
MKRKSKIKMNAIVKTKMLQHKNNIKHQRKHRNLQFQQFRQIKYRLPFHQRIKKAVRHQQIWIIKYHQKLEMFLLHLLIQHFRKINQHLLTLTNHNHLLHL